MTWLFLEMAKQLKMRLEPLNLELLPTVLHIGLSLQTTTPRMLQDNYLQQEKPQSMEFHKEYHTHFLSPRKRKLLHACAKGNVDVVKNLVQVEKVSPNFYNYDKRTPLHLAAAEGHFEIAQILVEAGASLVTCDRWGCTPLFDATNGKHQRLTQYFFDILQQNNIPTRRHSTSCSTPFDNHYESIDSLQTEHLSRAVESFKRCIENDEITSNQEQESNDNRGLYSGSIYHLQQINEEYSRKQKELVQIFREQKQNLVKRRLSRTQIED